MMYRKIALILFVVTCFTAITTFAQQAEPWRPDQLLEPKDLAATLNDSKQPQPLIISVGPAGLTKGSVETGDVKEKENLKKLRTLLAKEDKKKEIVIYCGCCPFKDCPNIRPAFRLLNEMHFVNHKLLNLPHNIKVDWLSKKYPVNDN